MNKIRKTLGAIACATLCCVAGAANAASSTFNLSYSFASGDTLKGTVVGTLAGTTVSAITAIDLRFDGTDFGPSLTTLNWDNASASYLPGLSLSTIASQNNFIIFDSTGTYSFSFSVSPDTGHTQVAATNLNSLDHSAAVEDALQTSWSVVAAPVPEPASVALLAAGLGLIGVVVRRRRHA